MGRVLLYMESRARCSYSLLLWYLSPASASAQLASIVIAREGIPHVICMLLLATPPMYSVA